jgi:DNA-binding GntR family transcriptional regulator
MDGMAVKASDSKFITTRGTIVEAAPLREQVADILRKMILKGELPGGHLVNERQLSAMLNVSTTPIKESLRILQTEGLVYTVTRKGTFVAEHPRKNAAQNVFARSALEGVAAYFAAQNATEEDIAEMDHYLSANDIILKRADGISRNTLAKLMLANNNNFHDTVRRLSQDTYLIKLIQNLLTFNKTMNLSLQIDPDEPTRAQRDHRAIFDAISRHSAEEAERLMVSHIRRVANLVFEESDKL